LTINVPVSLLMAHSGFEDSDHLLRIRSQSITCAFQG